ncbi:hypothetical protein [Hydrogenophaga sp. 5NK40-0174]|uniref:hypothetical protein n=1 Tax=Hydrogenophaga sp. 5NK40-0174 TaxID=3127649 RepID=UPI00310C20AB
MSERNSAKKLDLNSSAVDAVTTTTIASRRRFFGHVVLAGAASAVLAACGGGSDPLDVTDSNDGTNGYRLKYTYDNLPAGVGVRSADVEKMVGGPPNDVDKDSSQVWTNSEGRLWVSYGTEGENNREAKGIEFNPTNGPTVSRSLL